MGKKNKQQPQQRPAAATARPTTYIEVTLANGQGYAYDLETATALHNELGLALGAVMEQRELQNLGLETRKRQEEGNDGDDDGEGNDPT